jgi:dTDP-4-dehydrorhamnose 3,5-epimerase-like enzyme
VRLISKSNVWHNSHAGSAQQPVFLFPNKTFTPDHSHRWRTSVPLQDCRIIELPKIKDARGNLTFVEANNHVPLEIKRVYYLYDVPGGSHRGAHAHRNLQQFVVAMSGSFDVTLNDGHDQKTFHLNRSYFGLYVCPMMWRYLDNFSSGAVCMVLASECYDEADYIRDYQAFLEAVRAHNRSAVSGS